MENKYGDNILVYDIETLTYGKPDPTKDELRLFGCYSYLKKKFYLLTSPQDIQKVITAHKFLVGFNNQDYDNEVLKRFGINFEYKIIVDLFQIFKKRAAGMMTKKGMLGNVLMEYKLDYITRMLDLVTDEEAKISIDYKLFQKKNWTAEEMKEIIAYTNRDVEITKKLYEWCEEYFWSFRDFISQEDVEKKKYLTDTTAKFAYKAICKAMGWEELYNKSFAEIEEEDKISGGYVSYPAGERFEGNLYCLDFNSLYPHIMIQCNLYGRYKGEEVNRPLWTGKNVWEVQGEYFADEISGVGKLLRKWYFMRLFFKRSFVHKDKNIYKMKNIAKYKGDTIWVVDIHDSKNLELMKQVVDDDLIKTYEALADLGDDRREYTVKIIINTIYGILNTPYYQLVFDMIAGGDCTRIGRQWTKYARKVFREAGYVIIYSDTDSCYIGDPFNDKAKMLATKDKIIEGIKETVPFPQATFDMGIDDEIKFMFFFKGDKQGAEHDDEMDSDDVKNKSLGLMKKNYIYVTQDGKLKIKNLGIKKKNITAVSKKIFWNDMVPKIISEGRATFPRTMVQNLLIKYLQADPSLAATRKMVGKFEQYEKSAPNSFPAQIAKQYGEGVHFMIPNTRGLGVGKKTKYCTVEEFKENKMTFDNIDLSAVWSELGYFIEPVKVKNLFEFGEA
jgi:hypothetical protein